MRVACLTFPSEFSGVSIIGEACLRFSPQLCLKRHQTIFVEIGKCSFLFSEEEFIFQIDSLANKFKTSVKIVMGDSLLTSLILSIYGTNEPEKLPLHSFLEFFDPFQSDAQSHKLITRLIESLEKVGIKSVRSFLELNPSELSSRFGKIGLGVRMRILGQLPISWPYWQPAEIISEHVLLIENQRSVGLEPLIFQMKSSIDRIFVRLWGRGLGCTALELTLQTEKFSTVKDCRRKFIFDFILPQTSSRAVLDIMRERMDREFAKKPLESPIEKIELTVTGISKGNDGQRNLFHSKEEAEQAFNSVVTQLSEMLGKDKVFRPEVFKEAIPEKSWVRGMKDQIEIPNFSGYMPIRPSRLLRNPERVHLAQDNLIIRKKSYEILKWSSAEDISKDWISEEINRTYFKLELKNKFPVWIFKSPQDEYFLHGYFD